MKRELTVADMDLPTLVVSAVLVRPDEGYAQPYWSLRLSDTTKPGVWQYRSLTQAEAAKLGAHLLQGRVEAARDALRRLLKGRITRAAAEDAADALRDLDALLPAPAEVAPVPEPAALPLGHEYEEFTIIPDGADSCAVTYCGEPRAAHAPAPPEKEA